MNRIQIIEHDGKPAFAVVPIELWQRIRSAQDIADLERFDREDDGFRIPHAVVQAGIDGAHPVKAWREHRGQTLQALADIAGLSKPYLSQIESGKRAGTAATLKKLSSALGVPVDALVA